MKDRIFKIGDLVKIKEENNDMPWFSTELFTIVEVRKHETTHVYDTWFSVSLDKNLNNPNDYSDTDNSINADYIYLDLVEMRKRKLNIILDDD